jgi:hypothetical protein
MEDQILSRRTSSQRKAGGGETMCPFCLATLGFVVAGTVSTGGLAALAIKVASKKTNAAETTSNTENKGQ